MKWKIETSKSFDKKVAKLLKKNPSLVNPFFVLIRQLTENPFSPKMKTHALTGELKGKYACALTHELRIIFKLSSDTLHLLDIGTHDEVY